MSATRQKPHRRTLSISQANNSSSENLAAQNPRVENLRTQQYLPLIDTKTPNINNTGPIMSNTNVTSSISNTGNNFLSVIPEKISTSTPPSTPSKQKTYRPFTRRPQKPSDMMHSGPKLALHNLRNVLFTIVFFGALVIFLASLSGIGPVDEETHNLSSQQHEQVPSDHSKKTLLQDEKLIQDGKEKFSDFIRLDSSEENPRKFDHIESLPAENQQDYHYNPESHEDYETEEEEEDEDEEDEDNPEGEHEDERQHPVEDYLENHFDSNKATNLISEHPQPTLNPSLVDHENSNFEHTDELLVNNGDSFLEPSINELKDENQKDNEFLSRFNSSFQNVQNDFSNILKKKPIQEDILKDQQPFVSPSKPLDDVVDSNYTYLAQDPHFTYTNLFKSLSEEDRRKIKDIKMLKMTQDPSLDHSCGNWQEQYIKLHKDILKGDAPQRYVSYVCDASIHCGGLADRILGMTSTFMFALLTNRAFLAEWQVPLPLDTIFDSPNIDWNYNSTDPRSLIKDLERKELDVVNFSGKLLDQLFLHSNWTLKYPEHFINFRTNRGMVIRTFNSKIYAPQLNEMGMRPYTALGCIIDYLFKPTPAAFYFISEYTALLSLPTIFSVGIQIRTGKKSGMLETNNQQPQPKLEHYKDYFQCADQLSKTYAATNQKVVYFLITDSEKLQQEAVERLDNVFISGFPIDSSRRRKGHADGIHNAIIENWILSETTYRIISPGGYGKLAAFHSKKLHSTVAMYPPGSNDAYDLYDRQVPDCTREEAFVTFRKLASEWSLG
ncbi:hypothetical protein G9A89_012041 [Geosiphon pyriformis]|nr:hypothetical protein G9A89_012041 [Geosiphon pyriformis]